MLSGEVPWTGAWIGVKRSLWVPLPGINRGFIYVPVALVLLWVDGILHHLRNPGKMILQEKPMHKGCPWFQSDAEWILSIHIWEGRTCFDPGRCPVV